MLLGITVLPFGLAYFLLSSAQALALKTIKSSNIESSFSLGVQVDKPNAFGYSDAMHEDFVEHAA
jgi:hypothetical protein